MNEIDLNKNFWVFGINNYYPRGGLNDIYGTFDTLENAKKFVKNIHFDWIEIFDVNKRTYLMYHKIPT